jgi:heat shock protein HslJ
MHFRTLIILVSTMVLCFGFVMAQQPTDFSTGQGALAGSEWHLVTMGRVGASSLPAPSARVTLKFGNDGRISGSGGCNSYGGNYRVQGNRLTLSQVFSTKRACIDENANKQESQYFAALETASRFRLNRQQLTIYYGAGQNALDFASDSAETPDNGGPSNLPESPVAAVEDYYRAINAKDYVRAYRYWDNPSQSLDQFRRGFSDTASVKVLVDPSPQVEGAAGSSYASVSTVLISQRPNGGERLFAGCYEMKKSNLRPEDGALRQGWRISRANMSPVLPGARGSILSRLCRD